MFPNQDISGSYQGPETDNLEEDFSEHFNFSFQIPRYYLGRSHDRTFKKQLKSFIRMIILPLGYMKQCLKIEKHEKPQEILTLD
jgi:hypothetical protein